MGKGPEQTFLQRGHTHGRYTYEKMLKVTNHQKNANWNHNEFITSHLSELLSSINLQTASVGGVVEKRESLCTVMQIGAATVESSMELSKKLKTKLPYDPVIPLLGINLKSPDRLIWKNTCTPMINAVLSTIAKIWK